MFSPNKLRILDVLFLIIPSSSLCNATSESDREKSFSKNALGINDGNEVGLDLIIGQTIDPNGYPSESSYFKKWGDKTSEARMTFNQFVTMKGGEYFFAPSIPFLKNIE